MIYEIRRDDAILVRKSTAIGVLARGVADREGVAEQRAGGVQRLRGGVASEPPLCSRRRQQPALECTPTAARGRQQPALKCSRPRKRATRVQPTAF